MDFDLSVLDDIGKVPKQEINKRTPGLINRNVSSRTAQVEHNFDSPNLLHKLTLGSSQPSLQSIKPSLKSSRQDFKGTLHPILVISTQSHS
jgi:hypothetical protein